MDEKRKPYQGVTNIIRFNWHFYLMVGAALVVSLLLINLLPQFLQNLIVIGICLVTLVVLTSLLTSFYVYDLSDIYEFKWLDNTCLVSDSKILNLHAGFDETSPIIRKRFDKSTLIVCDFYDPQKHTEISIKRARNAYPPHINTVSVATSHLPFPNNIFDASFVVLSAHEIRNENERILFFKELNRVTKPNGQIIVTEHLRDVNNFLAYNLGFLHFHSRRTWERTFSRANLGVAEEIKTTPFITTFKLERNGDAL